MFRPPRAVRSGAFVLLAAVLVPACSGAPGPTVRDHYASLEDCAADWGDGRCDRLLSSGYAGGAFVFRSPPYPQNERAAARRQSAEEAGGGAAAVDPSRAGRAIATVREPAATDGARARSFGPYSQPLPPDDAPAETVAEALSGLPYFAAYYGIALMLLTLALTAHALLAPYPEIRLIRDGNTAAAAGTAGVLIGLALPLARVLEFSETLLDLLAWGGVVLAVQVLVFAGLRLAMATVAGRVREGQVASGLFLGAVAVALGLLNAAAVGIGFQ